MRRGGIDSRCKNCRDRARLTPGEWITKRRLHLLRKEKCYLERTLAHVNRWIARLSLVVVAACAAPPTVPTFAARVESAAVGVVEPKRVIDLKPLLNDSIARAMLQPEYSGTGPPPYPTFAPPPGTFRQLRRECVDESGGRPMLLMHDGLPKMGKVFRLIAWSPGERSHSILISTESATLPDGSPLPQPIRGAPGCFAEVRPDSVTLLESGRAEFDLILPPGSAGLHVFMQLATLASGVNEAGLLTSHGYEMVIGT